MLTLKKSNCWDEVSLRADKLLPGQQLEGFPFNEKWPEDINLSYEIILRDGKRCTATVDLSTQYRAEGIQWKSHDGPSYSKYEVAAWREMA